MADQPTTKKFGKGERSIPHHTQRASKYYPAEDAIVPKKVRSHSQKIVAGKRRTYTGTIARSFVAALHRLHILPQTAGRSDNLPHTNWNSNTDNTSRLARLSVRPRFASLSLPAPLSSSSLVASAASVSSSSSTSSRVSSSSPVPSKSTASPSEG
jgi:hypothetical protein